MLSARALLLLPLAALLATTDAEDADSFLVAVYEHQPTAGLVCPQVTRQNALRTMHANLDVFERQVKLAASRGAQMIVFPEYALVGIHPSMHSTVHDSHQSFFPYTDNVPDCESLAECCFDVPEPNVLTAPYLRVSYFAKKYGIFVVANLPDTKPCDRQDRLCPRDGRYQYNTNLMFNSSGCLVGKHYKHHLTSEFVFDAPVNRSLQLSVVDTPFGRLGTLICMDLLTDYPTIELIERYKINTLVFTTAWTDLLEQIFHSSRFHPAIATRHGVNVVSANLYLPDIPMTGSGIVSPGKAHVYESYQSDEKHRLLISRLPKRPKRLETTETKEESDYLRYQIEVNAQNAVITVNGTLLEQRTRGMSSDSEAYSITDGGDSDISSGYIFALHLRKPSANISLCLQIDGKHNFCCRLNYQFDESFEAKETLFFNKDQVQIDYVFEIGEGTTNFEGQSPTDKSFYHQYCLFCVTASLRTKAKQCITNRELAAFDDLLFRSPDDVARYETLVRTVRYVQMSADFLPQSYVYPEFQTLQRSPMTFANGSRTSHSMALRVAVPGEQLYSICASNFTCISFDGQKLSNASLVAFVGLAGRVFEKDEQVPLEERFGGVSFTRYPTEDYCSRASVNQSAFPNLLLVFLALFSLAFRVLI